MPGIYKLRERMCFYWPGPRPVIGTGPHKQSCPEAKADALLWFPWDFTVVYSTAPRENIAAAGRMNAANGIETLYWMICGLLTPFMLCTYIAFREIDV